MKTDNTLFNPYVIDSPVKDPATLLGRENFYRWVDDNIRSTERKRPLAVSGPPGIGKSSVLYNLTGMLQSSKWLLILIDAKVFNMASKNESIWSLVKATNRWLEKQNIEAPTVEKPMFTLHPERIFIRDYWESLAAKIEGKPLIVAVDNMEEIAAENQNSHALKNRRDFLWSLAADYDGIFLVFSIGGRYELYSSPALSPFDDALAFQLQPLSPEETCRLLGLSKHIRVPDHVFEYIYQLTKGHPADVQRLAHAVFVRAVKRGIRIVTLADLLAVLSHDLKKSDFYGPVYSRRGKQTLIFSPLSARFEFVSDNQ